MKKIILIVLCLWCWLVPSAYADVIYEVMAVEKYKGNIAICVHFDIDGNTVSAKYDRNGKKCQMFLYNTPDFAGLTNNQIKTKLAKPIKNKAKSLVLKQFLEVDNDDTISTKLNTLVGTTGTITETTIKVDTDGDGIYDEEWTVKTDGTKSVIPLP